VYALNGNPIVALSFGMVLAIGFAFDDARQMSDQSGKSKSGENKLPPNEPAGVQPSSLTQPECMIDCKKIHDDFGAGLDEPSEG
jgi:hypothetical protein